MKNLSERQCLIEDVMIQRDVSGPDGVGDYVTLLLSDKNDIHTRLCDDSDISLCAAMALLFSLFEERIRGEVQE